ncbi:AAA family ATPase [Rhodocytophaga rosea]|uniref:AAA family ATPase n=1 Tax=Rhodocytophaga rosea TaxID=2704465 RepID=A0A6C0GKM4_9BACT|nr:AAA family ATPase [Rhodocytophaga rosea]QHT68364.1 AAA family ATPase [Rhodocytophaga rosea]
MPELIDAYNSYNEFERTSYFTVCFNTLPSNLRFETQLTESKENMDSVIAAVDFDSLGIKEVFKNWNTEDDKNADSSNDYPYQYLLKSENRKLIIWIALESDELMFDFLYDVSDRELETWVVSTNQQLRNKFGANKSPIFKVLSRNTRGFFTKDVPTDTLQVNIEELYNDDFREINSVIMQVMATEKSGLILLHGAPGTGKTSYIKHLISSFNKKPFIFIQNEFIKDLLNPDFISFLLKNRNSTLIIEDAEKVITTREYISEISMVSTILQLTDGLFSDYLNIKIICTFNTNIERVDKALIRKGRMIASYEFKPLSKEKTNKLLQSKGYNAIDKEMILADIFNLDKIDFDNSSNLRKIGFKSN